MNTEPVNRERSNRRVFLQRAAGFAAGATLLSQAPGIVGAESETVFGVVGDYGKNNGPERRVSNLIKSWNPEFVTTTGDNVYTGAAAQTWDVLQAKVGDYYGQFINNRTFFPSLGNHDWGDPGTPMLACDVNDCFGAWNDYFQLPGNGRYYDVRRGNVHLFVLDDYYLEPDGNKVGSKQAEWLRTTAAASNAPWKVVVHHFSAYGSYGEFKAFRWPFEQWGIDAVFSGHHHAYERLKVGKVQYITTGTGGAGLSGNPTRTHSNRRALHIKRYGALRCRVRSSSMTIEMIDVDGVVLDRVDLTKNGAPPPPPPAPAPPAPPAPGADGIPTFSKQGPTTIITSPTEGQITGRTPTVEGWAMAPKGVSHVEVVLRNKSERNWYWNPQTGKLQQKFLRFPVPVKAIGDHRVSVWSFKPPAGITPGDYVARAWSISVNGNGDPFGNAIVDFTAR